MKTSKIISTSITFSLIFFMSVTSTANSNNGTTGDIVKSDNTKQIEAVKNTSADMTLSSENKFNHLRFDVNKFNTESEIYELPLNSTDYLRFDVNNFTNGSASEISELPLTNEFDYLRFDVNSFSNNNDVSEMPVN